MPSTYTLIKGETLASNAASYTFTAIPSTFTDLVIRMSLRSDGTGGGNSDISLTINGDTTTKYSDTILYGTGSAASSVRDATVNNTDNRFGVLENHTYTANTFDNQELYIPNYTSTTSKQMSNFGANENNSTTALIAAYANLYRGTTAITTILIRPYALAGGFTSGSSFYLYGISKS